MAKYFISSRLVADVYPVQAHDVGVPQHRQQPRLPHSGGGHAVPAPPPALLLFERLDRQQAGRAFPRSREPHNTIRSFADAGQHIIARRQVCGHAVVRRG